ncbi:MAG: NAD+ synthase [Flavobacteriales bacterium]|nr:NAD+ synthase [Flavobacteriales bacterium]MCB9449275.1 NAD+ synthase [Flavobacteriales bacterium]
MRIALAQINCRVGDFEANRRAIQNALQAGRRQQADLVVFPELAICGYPPRDFLEFEDFITQCRQTMDEIAAGCTDIAAIIGGPSINPDPLGKNLHNSAYLLADGKVNAIRHKSLLPNYDVFDEYRYFEPNRRFDVVEFKGHRIALTICEDLWDVDESDPLYTISPMKELQVQRPDVMINISASPFSYNHAADRREVMRTNATRYGLPLFYVNLVGAQTELIFDGGSLVIDPKGDVVEEMAYFEEDLRVFDVNDVVCGKASGSGRTDHGSRMAQIHHALVLGIRDYFTKLGLSKAVLGLSGGIDSAVTLVLAVDALGKENVTAVMMPSPFSSEHSVTDSEVLVHNLGCHQHHISISSLYETALQTMQPVFGDLPFNVAEENIQARLRALVLMALANKFGMVLLNTSNKSEAAVGYGTLYGDMCGGLSVIGDLYKTDVYELARYLNRDGERIPANILTKAPSAELRPGQKDSDSLPEYDVLDKILHQYIELRKGPREILAMGFDESIVRRTLSLVNTNEYKRFQSPPVLRVSPKAFGMGRRMPIEGKYLS